MRIYRPWPVKKELHAHMRSRQKQNLKLCKLSRAETWAKERLKETGYHWRRQAQWGFRLIDFWNHLRGIAVEIDGPEHDPVKDAKSDAEMWSISQIIVIRVKNFDDAGMNDAIERIKAVGEWEERRAKAKQAKRKKPKSKKLGRYLAESIYQELQETVC